jgi:hypothetical protein
MDAIIEKIKRNARGYPSLQEYAIGLMKQLDKNNDGFVDIDEFSKGL